MSKSWVVLALLTLPIPAERLQAQADSIAAQVDRFVSDGLAASGALIHPCTEANPVLMEALARDLDDERTGDLAGILGGMDSQSCPFGLIDRWLTDELLEEFRQPDRRPPSCNVDCSPLLGSFTEQRLWGALSRRKPGNAFDLWSEIIRAAPHPLIRAEAMRERSRALPIEERVALFLDIYDSPDLPVEFAAVEAHALAPTFVERISAEDLVALSYVPATEQLIDGIGNMALGRNRVSPEVAARALALLETALALSERGARYDRLWRRVQAVYSERGATRVN